MNTTLVVTTSWDDGHPKDMKLAELLAKHRIGGTFYVPCHNCERRDVMEARDLRSLAETFEIGGHTLDHIDLRVMSGPEAKHQIEAGKAYLEDVLGAPVPGFCYPRGGYTQALKEMVRSAGFSYARTVENFHLDAGDDRFALPTTLQFFPHSRSTYLRNFISGGAYAARCIPAATATAGGRIGDRIKRLAELCAARGSYFHLWGHSWEIDEYGLWRELDMALSFLSTLKRAPMTNLEAVNSFFR